MMGMHHTRRLAAQAVAAAAVAAGGVTRAQRSLILSYCNKRKRGKEWVARKPSRFLIELGVSQAESDSVTTPQNTRAHFAALQGLLTQKAN